MATAADKKKTTKTEAEKVDDLIDAIDPNVKIRLQRIAAGPESIYAGFDKTYKQQKLSFFPKIEFVGYIGKAISKATKDGVTLGELTGGAGTSAQALAQLAQADQFVGAISTLVQYAPDILVDVYCMALAVPRHERDIVAEILREAHDEETGTGGLTDEDGLAILKTFAYQNGSVMRDFYLTEVPKIFGEMSTVFETTNTPDTATE